ncbi:hypothetical protein ACFQGE_16875 [Halomicroarcula sp. GCM10025817]|uniref:hypothetical protein n=1 Tax=Haloarcula TaxID=2237 RepID=UPI0023E8467B|nr:hypothetical protein [Halomicroarcula sp. SYNS111]
MPSSRPFVDPATGSLDEQQILVEAVPLAKLIGLFVAISLVPFALVFFVLGDSALGVLVGLLGQFVLAVGAGVVLVYAVARGTQLAEA